jgi:hypothetical protein
MSRFKLIMLSALSVFTFSAVATAAASAHEWRANGVAITTAKNVSSSGGEFVLTAGPKSVTCKTVKDTGTVGPGATGRATEIRFEDCATGASGCEVKNKGGVLGTIIVTEIATTLEEVEGHLVDKFAQKTVGTTKEFVTLTFTGSSCAAAGYVESKVKGDVAAEVNNEASGEVRLTFPSTQIRQSPKLEAFGVASALVGSGELKLVPFEILEAD